LPQCVLGTLGAKVTAGSGRKHKPYTLATVRKSIPAGKAVTLTLTLPARHWRR